MPGRARPKSYRRLALLLDRTDLARDLASRYAAARLQLAVLRDNLEIAQQHRLRASRFENGVATRLDVANAEAQQSLDRGEHPDGGSRTGQAGRVALLKAARPAPRALDSELGQDGGLPVRPKEIALGIPSDQLLRRPRHPAGRGGTARGDGRDRCRQGGFPAAHLARRQSVEPGVPALARQLGIAAILGRAVDHAAAFSGWRLRGTLDLRKAEQQEAAIRYQQVVLGAWHEVDDALITYTAEERRRDSLALNVEENELALSVARRRYREGAIDFLERAERPEGAARCPKRSDPQQHDGEHQPCQVVQGAWRRLGSSVSARRAGVGAVGRISRLWATTGPLVTTRLRPGHLPWRSRPSGFSGPTGRKSHFTKSSVTSGRRVGDLPGLLERADAHQEDDAGLVLGEPELLDLLIEIELERVGHLLLHDLLSLLVSRRLDDRSDGKDFHVRSPARDVDATSDKASI